MGNLYIGPGALTSLIDDYAPDRNARANVRALGDYEDDAATDQALGGISHEQTTQHPTRSDLRARANALRDNPD